MPTREVDVWLDGLRVGRVRSRRPGRVEFRYSPEAQERWRANTPVVSCSLPVGPGWQDASNFFRGTLPEGEHLRVLAQRARVLTDDTFGLLARYGRDIAGALVVSDAVPEDRPGGVVPYRGSELDDEVAGLPERPLAVHDDSELSIAGLQDKLLLVKLGEGRWGRPTGGRPSTHILKVEDRRFPGMCQLEHGCLVLARMLGLTTVDAEVLTVAGLPCLIVSRFDRDFDAEGRVVRRVHQEDACQALNIDTDAAGRRGTYEMHGGPSSLTPPVRRCSRIAPDAGDRRSRRWPASRCASWELRRSDSPTARRRRATRTSTVHRPSAIHCTDPGSSPSSRSGRTNCTPPAQSSPTAASRSKVLSRVWNCRAHRSLTAPESGSRPSQKAFTVLPRNERPARGIDNDSGVDPRSSRYASA